MIKDVTRVFYLNLTSIHSWRSVIGGSVGVIDDIGVLGLKTSGDHAPSNETNDPGDTEGIVAAAGNEITGIEL